MSLFKLALPPGVLRTGTNYQTSGRWTESALVRFYAGTLRPFGGWLRVTPDTMEGPGRGILTWRPSSFARQAAIGTPSALYLWNDDELFNITPVGFPAGNVDNFYGVGFGLGPYGSGVYGISSGATTAATTWSLDTWGDFLVACASHNGVIYEYRNDGNPALPVANAPTALGIVATAERILVAIGADADLRSLAWSDIEDNTDWTDAVDNAAGSFRLQTDGTLVAGRRVRGTTLIFTTTDLFRLDFLGQPFIYRPELVAPNCGLIGPLAVQTVEGGAIWMGAQNFFRYAGGQVAPIPCDLQDYIFQDINLEQSAKFSSGQISAFSEVLFFYASAGSTTVNRAVSYNHREGHWTILGELVARGCWADAGAFPHPFAVTDSGILYEQESGWTADGNPLQINRYAVSGPVELGNGDQILEATQLIPDEQIGGGVRIFFHQRFTPEGPVSTKGPYTTTPYTPIRVTGRQVGVRIESLVDEDWRLGLLRVEASPSGQR